MSNLHPRLLLPRFADLPERDRKLNIPISLQPSKQENDQGPTFDHSSINQLTPAFEPPPYCISSSTSDYLTRWGKPPEAIARAGSSKVTLPSFREAFPEHLFPLPYDFSNAAFDDATSSRSQANDLDCSRKSNSSTPALWATESVENKHDTCSFSPVTMSQFSSFRWDGVDELSTDIDEELSDDETSSPTCRSLNHDSSNNHWERYTAEEIDQNRTRYYQCLWRTKDSACDYQTESKQAMKRHVQNTHMGIRSHICGVCQKGFSQKSALSVHEAVHTGVRSKFCEYCHEPFSDPARLHRHKKHVHNHCPKPRRKRVTRIPMSLESIHRASDNDLELY